MRQRETVKIDNREITVKELTVKEVLDRMATFENDLTVENLLIEAAYPCLQQSLEGVTAEELRQWTPSEIDILWEACKRVNGPLFRTLEKYKVTAAIEEIARTFMTNLPKTYSNLLKPDTPGFLNTAGLGSLEPGESTSES